MQAETMVQGSHPHHDRVASHGARSGHADPFLKLGVTAIVLAGAMLLAMLPSFAAVQTDATALPAPMPAPALPVATR